MLIIDTYNVLHAQGVLPPRLAGLGVPDLVHLISVSRYASRRLTLVCDGGPSGGVSGVRMHTAHILYAGSHLEADDVIERLIEKYHRGNSLDVVSTDRRLRRAAGRRGASSITSERFLEHLVEDERTPLPRKGHLLRAQVPLDPYSVDQWVREFGLTPGPRDPAMPISGGRVGPAEACDLESGSARDHPKKTRSKRRPPPRTSIGERMRITMPPERGPVDNPSPPALPSPPQVDEGISGPTGDTAAANFDPLLLAALEEWRDRLTLDDLDMQRWIPDADPHPRPPQD